MPVAARMFCKTIDAYGTPDHPGGENSDPYRGMRSAEVTLEAVYSEDPEDPNYSYSEATPNATFTMTINNRDAIGYFVPGEVYNITITKHQPQKARTSDGE